MQMRIYVEKSTLGNVQERGVVSKKNGLRTGGFDQLRVELLLGVHG
jgi:hypothetical protein